MNEEYGENESVQRILNALQAGPSNVMYVGQDEIASARADGKNPVLFTNGASICTIFSAAFQTQDGVEAGAMMHPVTTHLFREYDDDWIRERTRSALNQFKSKIIEEAGSEDVSGHILLTGNNMINYDLLSDEIPEDQKDIYFDIMRQKRFLSGQINTALYDIANPQALPDLKSTWYQTLGETMQKAEQLSLATQGPDFDAIETLMAKSVERVTHQEVDDVLKNDPFFQKFKLEDRRGHIDSKSATIFDLPNSRHETVRERRDDDTFAYFDARTDRFATGDALDLPPSLIQPNDQRRMVHRMNMDGTMAEALTPLVPP